MEKQVSVIIATKLEDAMRRLDEAVDYIHENVEFKERAPFMRAIGQIFAIMTYEIKPRLVKANPELHEVLFRGLPRNAAEDFLRMSEFKESPDSEK